MSVTVVNEKFLTAQEARELSESSMALKNHIYKAIKEEAKENRSELWYGVNGVSPRALDEVIRNLLDNDYAVSLIDDNETLLIDWR